MKSNLIHKILLRTHALIGDFWWYSGLLFVALRIGDVINAFVGLWLVPKYVPQQDLGAVLPMLQMTSFLGLPVAIVSMTFLKFLNQYHAQGHDDKARLLIRIVWGITLAAIVLGLIVSYFILPLFFERIRIVSGSLGILIVATAILSSATPLFTNALQALKKFNALSFANALSAPVRLLVMLVAMPFRALSGYMLGQGVPFLFQIAVSIFSLRKGLFTKSATSSFWKEDGRDILKFIARVSMWLGIGTLCSTLHIMILRQRIPEMESAAYYVISRLAEMSTYLGNTLLVVLLPFAAESQTTGNSALRMLLKALTGTALSGFAFAAIFAIWGRDILTAIPLWRPYANYASCMLTLAVILSLRMLTTSFINYEVVQNRWGFLWYTIPFGIAETIALYLMTAWSFFDNILPRAALDFLRALNGCHLSKIMYLWLVAAMAELAANAIQMILTILKTRNRRHGFCS